MSQGDGGGGATHPSVTAIPWGSGSPDAHGSQFRGFLCNNSNSGVVPHLNIFRRCYFLCPCGPWSLALPEGGGCPTPNCPIPPAPWEEGAREGPAQCPWDNGGCYTEKSPNPGTWLRWAHPAGQGPLLRCCRRNISPWKRLVVLFPLLKPNPVKPGWFGAGLRQLPSWNAWVASTKVRLPGKGHLHHSHHSWEHLDHGDLLNPGTITQASSWS